MQLGMLVRAVMNGDQLGYVSKDYTPGSEGIRQQAIMDALTTRGRGCIESELTSGGKAKKATVIGAAPVSPSIWLGISAAPTHTARGKPAAHGQRTSAAARGQAKKISDRV